MHTRHRDTVHIFGLIVISYAGTMGNTFRKLLDNLFGNKEMRVVMLGAFVCYMTRERSE